MSLKNFLFPTARTPPTPAFPPTSFQVLSDLHLELCQQYSSFTVNPKAPYLILAGDIGRLIDYEPFRAFLAAQCTSFTRVFLVLGNHEFYGASHDTGLATALAMAREACMDGRLTILHRERVDLDEKVTILGCSLWTSIRKDQEEMVRLQVSDFRMISDWSVGAHNEQCNRDASWLREEARKLRAEQGGAERRILVVTHHAPFVRGAAKPKNRGNKIESAFATDVVGSVKALGPGDSWIFGHTHWCMEGMRNGVRVFANQRGYVFPNGVSLEENGGVVKKAGFFGWLFYGGEVDEEREFSVERVIEV